MENYEYYNSQNGGGGRGGGIPRVFVGAPYQRGHGIGSFLGGLFRRVFPYLSRGVRAVGKEALRAGINVIEDVENNTPFKDAVKTRFKESGRNLKRKAKENLSNLMQGSGYKASAKTMKLQYPFDSLDSRVVASIRKRRRRRQTGKKKSGKSSEGRRRRRTIKKRPSKKIRSKPSKKPSKHRRAKKRSVSDIFS